jgi:hypothetical protein
MDREQPYAGLCLLQCLFSGKPLLEEMGEVDLARDFVTYPIHLGSLSAVAAHVLDLGVSGRQIQTAINPSALSALMEVRQTTPKKSQS